MIEEIELMIDHEEEKEDMMIYHQNVLYVKYLFRWKMFEFQIFEHSIACSHNPLSMSCYLFVNY